MTYSKEENIRKLVLGTAQFGLDYGISNKQGQISGHEASAILKRAKEAGIITLDTAAAYGESEACIARACRENNLHFRIISKYPPNQPELAVANAFNASLNTLGSDKIYGYLLHSFSSYRQNPGILSDLQWLKESGRVEKIGISLYHPKEVWELLEAGSKLDIVQFPYSVFDRRFEQVLTLLREHGVETHARSVFLQGLYFITPESLPERFTPVASKIKALHELAKQYHLPLGAILMGFVFSNPYITNIVIGIESLGTLQQNISYSDINLGSELLQEIKEYQVDNEEIILPYKWTDI